MKELKERSHRATLQAGQRLPRYVERGTQIVAVAGHLRIDGPSVPCGEDFIRPAVVLQEGEAHLVCAGGWICLSATSASAALHIAGRADSPAPWHRLLVVLERLRRGVASRYGT